MFEGTVNLLKEKCISCDEKKINQIVTPVVRPRKKILQN